LFKYDVSRFEHAKTSPEPEFIAFLSSMDKRGRMLDIGCGVGLESDFAHSLGFEVTGIDKDYGAIRKAKDLNNKVDFRQIDFFNYIKNVPMNEFTVIVDSKFSNKLIFPQLKKYYSRIAKALDHNGYLYLQVLSTTDKYCKEHCPQRRWTKVEDFYVRYFSKQELMVLLRLTGLNIEKFKTIKQTYRIEGEDDREETYHIVIAKQTIKKFL